MRDAPFYRLKAGAADLVSRCGGQARAGEIIGVSQQQISRICQRDDGAMFSIRAKLDLEKECGAPILSGVEADLLGFRLERTAPRALEAALGTPFSAHAQVMIEAADVARVFAHAVDDGVYSATDAVNCGKALSDLKQSIEAFERINAKIQAGSAM